MKRKETLQQLTKVEEEVMHHIWELERCVVRDILERIGDPELPHSTVSSVVRILEKKGFVDHKAYGKTHEYFPIVSREAYANSGVQNLLQKYFGGSPERLVSFLVKKEELSEKELAELLKTLSNAKKK